MIFQKTQNYDDELGKMNTPTPNLATFKPVVCFAGNDIGPKAAPTCKAECSKSTTGKGSTASSSANSPTCDCRKTRSAGPTDPTGQAGPAGPANPTAGK